MLQHYSIADFKPPVLEYQIVNLILVKKIFHCSQSKIYIKNAIRSTPYRIFLKSWHNHYCTYANVHACVIYAKTFCVFSITYRHALEIQFLSNSIFNSSLTFTAETAKFRYNYLCKSILYRNTVPLN